MGVLERRKREKESRRRSILRAAEKIFHDKGFPNTTVEEIAAASELSVGTLYLYFKSKEEIYVSLLFESIEYFTGRISRIERMKISPEQKVKRLWEDFYTFYRKNPGLFKIVSFLNNEGLPSALSPETVERINRVSGRNFAALSRILREGLDEGCTSDVEAQKISLLIWSLFLGLVSFSEMRENLGLPSHLKALHARAWEVMERGLGFAPPKRAGSKKP